MKSIWDIEELANHWSLSFEEMQLLKSKPHPNHLAFVSQLKFYKNSGRFPSSGEDISPMVLHLLQICMVYVNTLVVQQVLDEPQWPKRMKKEGFGL